MGTIDNNVINRIKGHGHGWCFTPKHFFDLGKPLTINTILFRLVKKGMIRRLSRGLYDYPKTHPKLGQLSPSAMDIAKALSYRDATRIQGTGALAANMLGLSEQVPAKSVFLTDGASRHVKMAAQEVILKRTTPRNMSTAGKVSGTVIQAMKYIGKNNITVSHINKIKKLLNEKEKKILFNDRINAPEWMNPLITDIAEDTNRHD